MAAMELGIPAIIGIAGDFDKLVDGAKVIMDTTSGQIMRWHK